MTDAIAVKPFGSLCKNFVCGMYGPQRTPLLQGLRKEEPKIKVRIEEIQSIEIGGYTFCIYRKVNE
jgi:hypothetical protein